MKKNVLTYIPIRPASIRILTALVVFIVLALLLPRTLGAQAPPIASYVLADTSLGGDCPLIGEWDAQTKTCTLTSDLSAKIFVGSAVTLDGDGYILTGNGGAAAVIVKKAPDVTVKNIAIRNASFGILVEFSPRAHVENVTVEDIQHYGLRFYFSSDSVVKDSTFTNIIRHGIASERSPRTKIEGNVVSNMQSGLTLSFSPESTMNGNTASYTLAGLNVFASEHSMLAHNEAHNNTFYGLMIFGPSPLTLRNNTLHNNRFNLRVQGEEESDLRHDIDTTNTVNGKPVWYLIDQANTTHDGALLDPATHPGFLACISCTNTAFKDLTLKDNHSGLLLSHSTSTRLTNLTLADNYFGLLVQGGTDTHVASTTTTGSRSVALHFKDTAHVNVTGNHVFQNPGGLFLVNTTHATATDNLIEHNETGLHLHGTKDVLVTRNTIGPNSHSALSSSNAVRTTFIRNNVLGGRISLKGEHNTFFLPLPIGGNHWRSHSALDENSDGIADTPFERNGVVDELPWVKPNGWEAYDEPPAPEIPTCCSNVAFLPGLQSSRLHQIQIFENRLWEPNRNADVEKLFMTETGESINDDIYVKRENGTVDQIYDVAGNIYESFEDEMDHLKHDEMIKDWASFPYDWRFSPKDIATGVIQTKAGTYTMVEEIERLATTSATERVTIIAHSNGGLVAKLLISELQRQGKAHLIDRLILVASPQIGTPKAVASMLHGYEQSSGFGFILRKDTARSLAENMPGAYGLLPSPAYFERVLDPVAMFFHVSATEMYRNAYGVAIKDVNEMHNFFLGQEGRDTPEPMDTDTPNILNSSLLDKAVDVQDILDAWIPPDLDGDGTPDIEVIQIAGWGLDTLSGIVYDEKKKTVCNDDLSVCEKVKVLDLVPRFTDQGDGTVVGESARYLSQKESVSTYYVDIEKHNSELFGARINRSHADILEIRQLSTFLKNLLLDKNEVLPAHISSTIPITDGRRLRISIHSPVSLNLYDAHGNHTGLIDNPNSDSDLTLVEQQIPNSYYMEFGEGKYIGFGTQEAHTVRLAGEHHGTFTIKVTEVSPDGSEETRVYEDIPTSPGMSATFNIQTLASSTPIEIDMDGDGTTDLSVEHGRKITPTEYLVLLRMSAEQTDMDHSFKKYTFNRLDTIGKMIEKGKEKQVGTLIDEMKAHTEKMIGKFLTVPQAEVLIAQLGRLRELVVE